MKHTVPVKSKPITESKTIKVSALAAVIAPIFFWATGIELDTETVSAVIGAVFLIVNFIMRLATNQPVHISKEKVVQVETIEDR